MALVHERLYRTENFAAVDLSHYLHDMVKGIQAAHGRSDVAFSVEVEEATVGIDRAVPCGLLVNELLTNAIKHAFPPPRGGRIVIGLQRAPGGLLKLSVRDDGVGMVAEINPREAKSMGMTIISGLVEQLEGAIEFRRGGGTCVVVSFPAEDNATTR